MKKKMVTSTNTHAKIQDQLALGDLGIDLDMI